MSNEEGRQRETISEAFLNRIGETLSLGDTGYSREVLFPIPTKLVGKNEEVDDFLNKAGKIARNKEYGLEITMEEETVGGVTVLGLVFEPTMETDFEAIKELLA